MCVEDPFSQMWSHISLEIFENKLSEIKFQSNLIAIRSLGLNLGAIHSVYYAGTV